MRRFPWAEFMALGLGRLKLAPREFWSSTPREIAAALPGNTKRGLPRQALDTLLQQFPDET